MKYKNLYNVIQVSGANHNEIVAQFTQKRQAEVCAKRKEKRLAKESGDEEAYYNDGDTIGYIVVVDRNPKGNII
jgi:hypothetical protein